MSGLFGSEDGLRGNFFNRDKQIKLDAHNEYQEDNDHKNDANNDECWEQAYFCGKAKRLLRERSLAKNKHHQLCLNLLGEELQKNPFDLLWWNLLSEERKNNRLHQLWLNALGEPEDNLPRFIFELQSKCESLAYHHELEELYDSLKNVENAIENAAENSEIKEKLQAQRELVDDEISFLRSNHSLFSRSYMGKKDFVEFQRRQDIERKRWNDLPEEIRILARE